MSVKPVVVRECPLDWVKFDAELARDGSVDPVDKALYAALGTFADKDSRGTEADPDGADVPTRKVLAACIGRSVDVVDRSTARLEKRGLIEVERRRDPDNPRIHLPSVYRLLDQHRWDARAAERHAARQAERGSRVDAARGSRVDAATRTDAARGSRVDAAVPCSCSEDLSPEDAGARAEGAEHSSSAKAPTEEREHFEDQEHDDVPPSAAPSGPASTGGRNPASGATSANEGDQESDHHDQDHDGRTSAPDVDLPESVVTAFVDARPGVPVSQATRTALCTGARTLLAEGVGVERLRVLAADMAVRGAGRWTDLARHAERNGSLLAVPAPRTRVLADHCISHPGMRLIEGECPLCGDTGPAAVTPGIGSALLAAARAGQP